MAVFNFGSINVDHVYQVGHLPRPGETISARSMMTNLGGKGANQSVAAARAGAKVTHIGAVGPEGDWAVEKLRSLGIDTDFVAKTDTPTGHAIINVDTAAENAIVIFPGANAAQDEANILAGLAGAGEVDLLMLQNETSHVVVAAKLGAAKGMRVIYSAAPFDAQATAEILPHISILVLNEVECQQLGDALGRPIHKFGAPHVIVTKGAAGAEWHDIAADDITRVGAFAVDPVDTTGAGDTFLGYVVAGLDQGLPVADAMRRAAAAAAIKVTRPGAAQAIPTAAEVDDFLRKQSD